jgi:transposase-like protein
MVRKSSLIFKAIEKEGLQGRERDTSRMVRHRRTHDPGIQQEPRTIKYLNNIVEQDHRGVKRITRPMLGFKAFEAAQSTLTGIELMHMLRQGQLEDGVEQGLTTAKQFYALAS